MKLPSIKIQLIGFLVLFAFYLIGIEKNALFLLTLFIAVSSAVITDSGLTYLQTKKKTITSSSVISGLIVGYVLSSGNQWWVISLASVFAIASKHFIRLNKRHLFNPAALGIFLAIILLGASTEWKGTRILYILIPAGFYLVYKIRRLEIAASYIASFLVLFGIQALIQKTPLLDVLKYQNYFFIFIMLVEHKTAPVTLKGKILFGISVAFSVFILNQFRVKFDAELSSLLILNLFVPVFNKI